MRAAVIEPGQHAPHITELDAPQDRDGCVRVTMRAAAVSPAAIRAANEYTGQGPRVVGVDGVGTLADGSPVYVAFAPEGSMAEQIVVPRSAVVPLPPGLDPALIAASISPVLGAWLAVDVRGGVTAGDTVLIVGATGAAGGVALELAKRRGARVLGAGRNPARLEKLIASGAVDAAISLDQPFEPLVEALVETAGQGIDTVVDFLWGEPASAVLEAVSRRHPRRGRTRYVHAGDQAGAHLTLRGSLLRGAPIEIVGSGNGSVEATDIRSALPKALQAIVRLEVQVPYAPTPIEEVGRIWRATPDRAVCLFT